MTLKIGVGRWCDWPDVPQAMDDKQAYLLSGCYFFSGCYKARSSESERKPVGDSMNRFQ